MGDVSERSECGEKTKQAARKGSAESHKTFFFKILVPGHITAPLLLHMTKREQLSIKVCEAVS